MSPNITTTMVPIGPSPFAAAGIPDTTQRNVKIKHPKLPDFLSLF